MEDVSTTTPSPAAEAVEGATQAVEMAAEVILLSESPKRSRGRRLLLVGGALAAAGVAAVVVYRRFTGATDTGLDEETEIDTDTLALGWGEGVDVPEPQAVHTKDGAELAVWDVAGSGPDAPVVVLSHGWACGHETWIPVARRLHERGDRVVLYDQRGHGVSTRGTAPLDTETLAHDLEAVLEATDVRDAILAGHSMGGMAIMSLATLRPDILRERAKAIVLVSAAATSLSDLSMPSPQVVATIVGSRAMTLAMRSRGGHLLMRHVFGESPVQAHVDLTRELFAQCEGSVRGGYIVSLSSINLLDGIATLDLPTTVMVGSQDILTPPAKSDEIVETVPGAHLVTLEQRGHMLPLEDPDAVTDEIVRAVKG
jgi:non-heme chloroperoxidase